MLRLLRQVGQYLNSCSYTEKKIHITKLHPLPQMSASKGNFYRYCVKIYTDAGVSVYWDVWRIQIVSLV